MTGRDFDLIISLTDEEILRWSVLRELFSFVCFVTQHLVGAIQNLRTCISVCILCKAHDIHNTVTGAEP